MNHKARIYAFLVLLALPAILTLALPQLSGDSVIELRALQSLPDAPDNLREARRWPQQFDQFTADRFPFREPLINYVGAMLYKLGLSISPEVLIGSDDWLFLKKDGEVMEKSRGISTISAGQTLSWAEEYARRRDYLRERGIKLLFVIAPNKHAIYPQFMHDWNFKVGATTTDLIFAELGKRGVEDIIDLRPLLIQASKSERVYGRYNTHWNDRGSFFAYQEIIRHLPGARQLTDQDLVFRKTQVPGDLSRLIGNPDLTEESLVVDPTQPAMSFEYGSRASKNEFHTEGWIAKTSLADAPTALFICDSFTNDYLSKYLAPSFREAWFRHHNYSMAFDKALIEQLNPDYVVYIVSERFIPYHLE